MYIANIKNILIKTELLWRDDIQYLIRANGALHECNILFVRMCVYIAKNDV